MQSLNVARLGDNMRQVAVTEGDKVEAQLRLGVAVRGDGVGELTAVVDQVDDAIVERLLLEYDESYEVAPSSRRISVSRGALICGHSTSSRRSTGSNGSGREPVDARR